MHPRSKRWHLIDYVITRQRDLKDIHDTRAMCGADCNTDHIMIKSCSSLIIKRKIKKSKQPSKKLNVNKLKDKEILDDLKTAISEKLRSLKTPGTLDNTWKNFKDTVYKTLKEKLSTVDRKYADWYDEHSIELQDLLGEKNLARSAVMILSTRKTKEKYSECNIALQKKFRKQNKWWQAKAAELQELANRNDMRGFYQSMRAVWVNYSNQLFDKSSHTLLTQRDELMQRWTEHFQTLLNKTGNVDPYITRHIHQQPTQEWMNECPVSQRL